MSIPITNQLAEMRAVFFLFLNHLLAHPQNHLAFQCAGKIFRAHESEGLLQIFHIIGRTANGALAHIETFGQIVMKDLCCPNTELCRLLGIDTITDGDYNIEII
jgi:hypothetical protein